MSIKIKSVVVIFAFFIAALIAEDEKVEIIPKLIKLDVKKLCKPRKIKSKEQFPRTEGGIDYQRDDKTDFVTITVSIENKNKASLKSYQILTYVYGKSVTEKRAKPEIHSEFSESIDDLKSRGKFKKEFKCEMVYDKSDDSYEKDREDKNGEKVLNAFTQEAIKDRKFTPAFGSRFYGYKVDIVDEDGKVILTKVWPGGLEKILKKAEENKTKEKKEND